MNKKTRIIFFLVGLSIFIYLIIEFGLTNILINIEKIGWWFLPIIAVWGLVYLFNSYAWYIILEGKKNGIRFKDILSISISGFSINYITPFINLGGEPFRVMSLKDSIGIHNSVSSVILYRMIHILGSFFFWITGIIVVAIVLPLSSELKVMLFAVSAILLALIWFFFSRHKRGIFRSVLNLFSKIKILRKLNLKLKSREKSLLIIDEQIIDLYLNRKSVFYFALFLEYAGRVMASFEFYFILIAIGFNATIVESFFINAGSSIVMNMLFFVPFELGTREGSLYFILKSLGFTAGVGVFIAVVNRIREFFWILVGLLLIQIKGKIVSDKKDILDYI